METMPELSFACQFMKDGRPLGLFDYKATATQTELIIGEDRIPYDAIAIVRQRDMSVAFTLLRDVPLGKKAQKAVGDERVLVLAVHKKQGRALTQHVNRVVSQLAAERHHQELLRTGQADQFHTVICPHCGATIDCSGAEITPYIQCVYCQTIMTRELNVISDGTIYQHCPSCSMYGRIRKYTSFQFYFLVIAYGYSYQQVFLCDTCAEKLAKRNLLVNLIFILGVPMALIMWVRALSKRDSFIKALDRANELAAKGNYTQSDEIYTMLLQDQPEHPAILMNQALGHFNAQDTTGGSAILQRALRACSSYAPALWWIENMRRASKINAQYG